MFCGVDDKLIQPSSSFQVPSRLRICLQLVVNRHHHPERCVIWVRPLFCSLCLTKALGSHYLYPFTFLWAPSQQSPSLAFSSNTRLTKVEAPLPKPSSSAVSLGWISLWTPTHSTIHPRCWNNCLEKWCRSSFFGLLSKSFPSSSQHCRCWVLERGNSRYATCKKWRRSRQYAIRRCSKSWPCYFPVCLSRSCPWNFINTWNRFITRSKQSTPFHFPSNLKFQI